MEEHEAKLKQRYAKYAKMEAQAAYAKAKGAGGGGTEGALPASQKEKAALREDILRLKSLLGEERAGELHAGCHATTFSRMTHAPPPPPCRASDAQRCSTRRRRES